MSEHPKRSSIRRLAKHLQRYTRGATNALEMLTEGRLGAPYRAPYEVVLDDPRFTLRRYSGDSDHAPASGAPRSVLLVPPLMVTSEIYDISPELSAVGWLSAQGVDVWLIDFGTPETHEGGMKRTLDDHIQGVDHAISEVVRRTGDAVHLVGYSQGGMFCYQVAAFRRSTGIASIVTFGSPVDIHRNLPAVSDSVAGRLIGLARRAMDGPLKELEGVPGFLTSRGFKLLAPRQELKHLIGTLGLLHDRDALEAREPRRKFLGGEGFISWPGPAFREFVDQVVVDNRMTVGGIVVAGRTLSMNDITCPVLFFVGTRDDIARPASVRAIARVATRADLYESTIAAGHFGLVVGSNAMNVSWPTVAEWLAFVDTGGPCPPQIHRPGQLKTSAESETAEQGSTRWGRTKLLYDLATDVIDGVWHRLADVSDEVGDIVDSLRWQLPRLSRLESLTPDTPISLSLALSEQAETLADAPFFLWKGKAYTYRQADRRVTQMAALLAEELGVRRGDVVGVLMANHPDYLSVVAACSRLGAVAALLNSDSRGVSLTQALASAAADFLVTDVVHMEVGAEAFATTERMMVVLRPGEHPSQLSLTRPAGADEVLAWHVGPGRELLQTAAELPDWITPDPGRAEDLALLMFTSGTTGLPKAARITNRRWATAALGAAALCRLTPHDTVYCCLPLHHSTGQLVAVGGAVIGGARLALAETFSVSGFWTSVRHVGATVVFYVGELCRYLVKAPAEPNESTHPVRLFVGNGMRTEVWNRLVERFGPVKVIEFYGSTEGNAILANVTGDKVGSVGRPIWHSGQLALLRYDIVEQRLITDEHGFAQRSAPDEPGLLVARVGGEHPGEFFDGYKDAVETESKLLRDVFTPGDAWFNSGDLLRSDEDGDFWFVDRVGDTYRWKGENVSTELVASVLSQAPEIALAAVYGIELDEREGRAGMAAVQLVDGATLDGEALYRHVSDNLFPAARPRFLRVVESLAMTDTLKVKKFQLAGDGADPGRIADPLFYLDDAHGAYRPLTLDAFHRLVAAR